MKIKLYLLPILVGLATTLFFSFPVGDADLGWHLKYGEYTLATGKIMRDNQFSWQMPDYQWANHSWGFDVIAAALFGGHRFWALSISAGLITALCVYLMIPTITWGSLISTGLFVFLGKELLNIGLRSQYFSLLGTVILWRLLVRLVANPPPHLQRWHASLPVLFLIWVNLHGQFIYGIGLLGLTLAVLFFQSKKAASKKAICIIGFSSLLTTLINPFTYHIWTTAAAHLNAPELRYINEWASWPLTSPLMYLLISYTVVVWWQIKKQRLQLSLILPLAAMTILALTSRRIIPYYLLLTLPIIAQIGDTYFKKLPRQLLLGCVGVYVCFASYTFIFRDIFHQSWDRYCHTNVYCSEKAAAFIQQNHLQGKWWNAYRLGGYLIYRVPEIKPMIDGRMTLWHRPDGSSAFQEYTTMVYVQKNARALFDTINPDYVIIQPQYPLAQALITEGKWPVIFQDEQVLIFKHP